MKYFAVLVFAFLAVTYVMAGVPVPCYNDDDCTLMCNSECITNASTGVCANNICFCMLIRGLQERRHG